MMKKVLTVTAVLTVLPSLLFADPLSKRWGVGANFPGVGLKYGINSQNTLEIRTQFGKDILVIGPRYYRNLNPEGQTVVFLGGEADYLSFKGEASEGSGFVLEAFVGGEYFTTPNLGLSLDIGPAYISLKDKDTSESEGGVDFVTNLGLTYYFGGGK
ncbi:MAG: hypothetical protein QME81_05185 [bacterium]|nr:hypothetical protein [bacterium]